MLSVLGYHFLFFSNLLKHIYCKEKQSFRFIVLILFGAFFSTLESKIAVDLILDMGQNIDLEQTQLDFNLIFSF